jgi:preprotein translocase subunit SecF
MIEFSNPVVVAILAATAVILLLLCKATGLRFFWDKSGKIRIEFSTKGDKSLTKIGAQLEEMQKDISFIKEKNKQQDALLKNISKDQLRLTIFTDNLSMTSVTPQMGTDRLS